MNKRIRKKLANRCGVFHYRDYRIYTLLYAHQCIMCEQLTRINQVTHRPVMIGDQFVNVFTQVLRFCMDNRMRFVPVMRSYDKDYILNHMILKDKIRPRDIKKKLKPILKKMSFEQVIYTIYQTEEILLTKDDIPTVIEFSGTSDTNNSHLTDITNDISYEMNKQGISLHIRKDE